VAFAEIVSELVGLRSISMVREGFEQPGHTALLQCENGLLVPRHVLSEALAKQHLSPPDPLQCSPPCWPTRACLSKNAPKAG
jgi:hypothetical protein